MQMGWNTHGICCAWTLRQLVEHIRYMILESSSVDSTVLKNTGSGDS